VKALAAATAQATKTKTLDVEDITVGIGTPFVGSNQVAHFRAQVLDAHGTTLTNIGFVLDPECRKPITDENFKSVYHVKPGDTACKCLRKPTWKCVMPKGFADALQGLYPGGHRRIAVPTQTYYDDVQHTRWLILLESSAFNDVSLKVKQNYLDGLYVKVWIEQLQVPTDDSRIIQYDYRPLVDDAVHTQEVLRQATLPGTLVCSQDGCGSCMAVVQELHRNPGDAFKCKHVADKARALEPCRFCKEFGHSIDVCEKAAQRRAHNAALEAQQLAAKEAKKKLAPQNMFKLI